MMLKGKVAWITGAGTGIGLAGAKSLAEAGATVVMSGRRKKVLDEAAATISTAGATITVHPLDVTDAKAVQKAAETIIQQHGQIDILINNAGINTPNRFYKDQTIDGWNQVVRINLDGTFYCIKAVLDHMRKQKEGLIINVASWAGVYNAAIVGPAYNGTKHAVVSITETLNMEECQNNIRACAICPGEVNTPIMDSRPVPPPAADRKAMLQPEDLGKAICWVAQQPPHVCINQMIISPTWNRLYVGSIEKP